MCFRSSHFSVGAHPSGVVVPNASPVVQLGLPGLCHLSAAASGRAPPFRLSSFPYPRVPVLYDSIAAGPRQAAVATPVAGGCRFVPVGALVLGPYALPLSCGPCLQWTFGCFSSLFASRVCSTMPPNVAVPDASPAVRLRLICLATLSPCLGTCSLSGCLYFHIQRCLCSILPSLLVLAKRPLPHLFSGSCRVSSVGDFCSILCELRPHCGLCLHWTCGYSRLSSFLRARDPGRVTLTPTPGTATRCAPVLASPAKPSSASDLSGITRRAVVKWGLTAPLAQSSLSGE